jgi:hypothetical protein
MKRLSAILNKLSIAAVDVINQDIPEPRPGQLTGCSGEPIGANWPFLSKKGPGMPETYTKCEIIRDYYAKLKQHLDACRLDCLRSNTGGFDDSGFTACLKRKYDAYIGGSSQGAEIYNVPAITPEQQVSPNSNIPSSTVNQQLVKDCAKAKVRCQCEFLRRKYEYALNSAREAELFINGCSPEYHKPDASKTQDPSLHEQFRRRCFPVRNLFPVENKCAGTIENPTYGTYCMFVCNHCGVTG